MTCHPDLQRLFREVVKAVDCTVLCGHRGREEQEEAFALGHSKARWGESKHNSMPSMACDIGPVPLDWSNIQRFREFAVIVKEQAARMGIKVIHGGDWAMKDWPHWELVDE